ncbi:hypothetical protein D3C72_2220110 [compost metagenome]
MPGRISVPGDDVHFLRELAVVQSVEPVHKIGRAGQVRIRGLKRYDLMLIEINRLVGHEAPPVQVLSVHHALAVRRRRLDLGP